MKGRRNDIHLAVTNHDVSVRAKTINVHIFMCIVVSCVKKISMANYQIDKRKFQIFRCFRISSKNIEDGSAIMKSRRDIAIGIKISLTARIFKSLNFISLGIVN